MNIPSPKKYCADQTGFTLIEVMIALAIFSIGFLAVAAMQINALQSANRARKMTTAQDLANREVEYLEGLPIYDASHKYSTLNFYVMPDLTAGTYQDNGAWTGGYTIHWTVVDNDPLPAVPNIFTTSPGDPASITVSKTITVTVTADNDPQNTTLASMVMVKMWDTQ